MLQRRAHGAGRTRLGPSQEVSGHAPPETVRVREALEDMSDGPAVFTIGRNSSNNLSLDHPDLPLLISRHHAQFKLEAGKLAVQDLRATNGTWINEAKLSSGAYAVLRDGDTVSFGGPGNIMKDGQPCRNPFVYCVCENISPRSDRDSDGETTQVPTVRPVAYPLQHEGEVVPPGVRVRPAAAHLQLPGSGASSPRPMDVGSPRPRDLDMGDHNPSPSKRSRRRQPTNLELGTPATSHQGPSALRESGQENVGTPGSNGKRTMQALENQFECVVCQTWLISPHSLVPCGHMFCGKCLGTWLKQSPICPTCRAEVAAPPVRCRPVENLLHEVVEKTLSPEERMERLRQRKEWDAIATEVADEWKSMFSQPARGNRAQAAPRDASVYNASNYNLNHMLDNLRQVRETLRSVTHERETVIETDQGRPSYTVEYARNGRSRCARCREAIAERGLRVGIQRHEQHGQQARPYQACRWHHFECVPDQSWEGVSPQDLYGLPALASTDQNRVRARLSGANQN